MADATTVVEGKIKFREGKKWKPRWCVLKKPSPVADRLQVLLYKDLTEYAKNEAKPKSVFALDSFFGLDAGFTFDRELHVLAIICYKTTSLMAFELRENMIQFEIKIRQSMGEEHQFPVKIVKAPSSSRTSKDPVRLIIHDMRFCLIAQTPPKILLSWNIEDLRRFGATEGKFCFEGGTRCGKGSGVFALQSEQAEDIASIVHLASTGKIANCHRKFKNRSSQIDLSSHPNADLSSSPSSLSIHHPHHADMANRASPQAALPVTLNCCHDNQTGSAESEDWSWYKRHSVSVMDHHRMATFREETYPDSREQLTVGIYDVPPSHARVLDDSLCQEESNYAHPRAHGHSAHTVSLCNTPASSSVIFSCADYGNYKRIVLREREYVNSVSDKHKQATLYKRQSASAELLDNKVSSLDEMLSRNEQKDSLYNNSREESLQRLKKQESDLQREMVLLDEILQNCSTKGPELLIPTEQAAQHFQDPVLRPAPRLAPNSLMSSLDRNFIVLSGNISSLKLSKSELSQSTNLHKLDRATVLRLNTSMPEGAPSSPLFHAKLCNIPPSSRLNAPLPYVNLSKYDDESNSHVHLPGSADCVPASNMQVLHDWNQGLRAVSLSSLPPVASINPCMPAARQQPLEHRPAEGCAQLDSNGQQWKNAMSEREEILVVNMKSQSEGFVQAAAHPSMLQDDTASIKSDIVHILTTDARRPVREERQITDIYENLPIRKQNTPPPELPPKGADLLNKLKAAASMNRSFSCPKASPARKSHLACPTEKGYGYDNHPRCVLLDKEISTDMKEDNYLIMGSPKIKHKESKPNASFDCGPARSEREESAYLGMANLVAGTVDCCHDDEVYLDVDTTSQESRQRDLYISEADLKAPASKNFTTVLLESTYMEMSQVSGMKTLALKHGNSTEKLVRQTHLADNASPIGCSVTPPTPVPLPPPRPMSLKVRHNSDSIVSSRLGEPPNDDRNKKGKAKPVKSPTRVYTKMKKSSQQKPVSEPPMPFPNLIEFSKKMSDSRSTYVNTYVDADKNLLPQEVHISRDVPLPEPVKEGFLARFKRRSSREKNVYQAHEKSGNSKNRNSVLERSISEHESTKAAKEEKCKLKVGRRRSSSFPNQLTYQEFLDSSDTSIVKQAASSSSSFSSGSSRPKPEYSESSSSVRDFSDDSDMSPLLKRADKRVDAQTLTVLHVERSERTPINPYQPIYKLPVKAHNLSTESSKTDDEKLIEIIQSKCQTKKAVIYQRSSSLELKSSSQELEQPPVQQRKDRRFSFDKLTGCPSSLDYAPEAALASVDSNHYSHNDQPCFNLEVEQAPPSLPPKTRPYQGPLSPVIETAPPISTLTEPIYVDMDEFLSSVDVGRARIEPALHVQPVAGDEVTNSRASDVKTKAGRLSQPASQEVVSEVSYNLVVVAVDDTPAPSGGTISSSCSCPQTSTYINNITECTNPAKSVLRPRSGSQYVLIHRKPMASLSATSSRSPLLNNVFNFELNEAARRCSHRHSLQSSVPPLSSRVFLSEHSCLPNSCQQVSPSISSTTDTIRSTSSMHFHAWEHEHSHGGRPQTSAAMSSPASSPYESSTSRQQRSAPAANNNDSVFFPMDMTFCTSPPFGPHASAQHTPIYVNQEFVDKHHIASSSSQTMNTHSSHASASPIRAGVHSLMSLFFKDSSKHSHPRELNARGSAFRIGRARSRRSESDANKADTQSLSPPSNKQQHSVPHSAMPRRCHSEDLPLSPDIHLSTQSRVHHKEYDKFTDSSIISRRRRKHIETLHSGNAEDSGINHLPESGLKDSVSQYLALPKSSGYKNIDSINAAACTPSPRSLSSGPDASHAGQTSQLENIMESHHTPEEMPSCRSDPSSLLPALACSNTQSGSCGGPHPSSPPPLLPRRNRLSLSLLSSCSVTSVVASSDSSDSPPSYFAPSPPGTLPPPVLPPRMPMLSPPAYVPVCSPLEAETTTDSSQDEQELNYIEVDMTRSQMGAVVEPPPLAFSRRSKRARQQKEKDYAKLRYAVIDHRATKALQEARQEHEQCRDSSLRHSQPGNPLNRINSAPASSKRKQIPLMHRERKLSSGSTESC